MVRTSPKARVSIPGCDRNSADGYPAVILSEQISLQRLGRCQSYTLVRDQRAVRQSRADPADIELRYRGLQVLRLLGQGVAGGGGLFDHRRVLLGDLVHLVHGGVALGQTDGLFLGQGCDFGHQTVDLCDPVYDPVQGFARLTNQFDARADLTRRRRDQGLDLLGGSGRTLGQGANFGGDHRKAATGLAGTGGLDAGVQGQKVGLKGDLADDADDLVDLAGRTLDRMHRRHRVAHDHAGDLGIALGGPNDIGSPSGARAVCSPRL